MTEKVKKKHIEFKDHIGIYDGYIPNVECDKAIQYFEKKKFIRIQRSSSK